MRQLLSVFVSPVSVAQLFAAGLMMICVVVGVIDTQGEFGWCCGGSGERELVLVALVVVVPIGGALTIAAHKSRYRVDGIIFEHLRQSWLLYLFLAYGIYIAYRILNNPHMDSGEPGRAFVIIAVFTVAVSITTNLFLF